LDPTILFRSAQNEELLRGRSIEAIAAASVYGACRATAGQEAGRWVTQAAAADVANVTTTTIRRHRDALQQFATVQRSDRVTQATRENPLQSSR